MDDGQRDRDEAAERDDGIALHRASAEQAKRRRLERFRSSGDSSLMGQVVHKVCCVCGTELNHRPRFKDAEGRYWCPTCNEADHVKKQLVLCADCRTELPRAELKEQGGDLVCSACLERRRGEHRLVGIREDVLPTGASMSIRGAVARDPEDVRNWLLLALAVGILLMGLIALFMMGR